MRRPCGRPCSSCIHIFNKGYADPVPVATIQLTRTTMFLIPGQWTPWTAKWIRWDCEGNSIALFGIKLTYLPRQSDFYAEVFDGAAET
jgi:hypothetical protein